MLRYEFYAHVFTFYECLCLLVIFFSFLSSVYTHLLVFTVGDKHFVLLFLCCCMFLPTLNKYLLTYFNLVCMVKMSLIFFGYLSNVYKIHVFNDNRRKWSINASIANDIFKEMIHGICLSHSAERDPLPSA